MKASEKFVYTSIAIALYSYLIFCGVIIALDKGMGLGKAFWIPTLIMVVIGGFIMIWLGWYRVYKWVRDTYDSNNGRQV